MLSGPFSDWTREELVRRLLELDPQNSSLHKTQHMPREIDIDMSCYRRSRIALRVMYNGARFQGFASQSPFPHSTEYDYSLKMNTVEDHLFRAIYRTRLATPGGAFGWSRAGRTDAGVSAAGQVVACTLRSSSRKAPACDDAVDIDYAKVLNGQLPNDIRVTGWTVVPHAFDARFSCIARQYKYFFSKAGLDIGKMKLAAAMIVGQHDFRNFCRKDPSKTVTMFERRLLECKIEDDNEVTACLTIKGTAFLYNQVRCTMAVLLMVGQGLEPPEIANELLDIEKYPRRPLYNIASEKHLVLEECFYDPPLRFAASESARNGLGVLLAENAAASASLLNLNRLSLDSIGLSLQFAPPNGKHLALKDRDTER